MPPTYAPIATALKGDGINYATSVPLTATEADVYNGVGGDPVQIVYGQAVLAIVKLVPRGNPISVNSYVVMQTDLNSDGTWFDVAWCVHTNKNVTGVYALSGGVAGANSVTQARQAGSFPTPQANGSNQIPLGGRVRFVGKADIVGGSSLSPGIVSGIDVSVTYKLLGLK